MAISPQNLANDIRAAGWAVAIHNDYRLNGRRHTFWLFTMQDSPPKLTYGDGWYVKGEGFTDAQALNEIRRKLGLPIPK